MEKPLCRLHPDYHLPADVDAGRGFDGLTYCQGLKAHGCDAFAFFSKCHYGHSYYPTKVGHVHPRLQCDMLGEACRGARETGLGLTVYHSVFLDTVAVEKRPDWRVVFKAEKFGEPIDVIRSFEPVCVNSGYVEELMLPQTAEIVEMYDFDEMFFDTMSQFTPCYCDHCREKFGRDIPVSEDDPHWLEYVAWYKQCFDDCYTATARTIHDIKPDVGCVFNWEWGIRRPCDPPPFITGLDSDFPSSGLIASQHCRYYAGTHLPFDYMTGRFLHNLSEWDNAPAATLKYTASGAIANGGGFYIIDRHLPDGSLEPRAYEMMDQVFGFINERRDAIAGVVHVPEVAVLASQRSLFGPDLEDFPRQNIRKEKMRRIEGISDLFIEHGRHFTVISEDTFSRDHASYPLLIVPEQNFLEGRTEALLRRYVENGGIVIVTQADNEGDPSPAILDLAGVAFDGFREAEYGYVGTELPFHARGRFAKVTPLDGTEVLFRQVEPLAAGNKGKKFGHGMAPPGEVSEYAAVTKRPTGKGAVVYVALPLAYSYACWQNPYLRGLLFGLIDDLLPDAIAKADTPAQVELVTTRRGDDLVVNLVNHSGKVSLGGYFHTLIEYVPPVRDVRVSFLGDVPSVALAPSGETLSGTHDGGRSVFVLPELEYMQTLTVPGYLAREPAQQESTP